MRILHTADWHLGRTLGGASLLEDQAHLLDELVRLAADAAPDLVIVAGDLFDRAVPPVEAVELLDEVLCRLVIGLGRRVVAIAGNHDSPKRLAFGARLLAERGLTVVTDPAQAAHLLQLGDAHGPIELVAMGYAEPAAVRLATGSEVHDHAAALAARLAALAAPRAARRLLIAHLFVAGGAESESERPLSVGGATAVPVAAFEGFTYAALGHLHRPQGLAAGRVRYAGSLMKYGFGEADQQKSVALVEVDAGGGLVTELLPLAPRRDLVRLRGTMAELLRLPVRADWIAVELLDTGAIFDADAQLRERFPNLVQIARPLYAPTTGALDARAARERGMAELFADFATAQIGLPPEPAELRVFAAAWDAFERGEREATA
jgi:exonuclease SbcD